MKAKADEKLSHGTESRPDCMKGKTDGKLSHGIENQHSASGAVPVRVQSAALRRAAKESGKSLNTLRMEASRGRAIVQAGIIAPVDPHKLAANLKTKAQSQGVSKVVNTPISPTSKLKASGEQDRIAALERMQDAVPADLVAKDWLHRFESLKVRATTFAEGIKALEKAQEAMRAASARLKELGLATQADHTQRIADGVWANSLAQVKALSKDADTALKNAKSEEFASAQSTKPPVWTPVGNRAGHHIFVSSHDPDTGRKLAEPIFKAVAADGTATHFLACDPARRMTPDELLTEYLSAVEANVDRKEHRKARAELLRKMRGHKADRLHS